MVDDVFYVTLTTVGIECVVFVLCSSVWYFRTKSSTFDTKLPMCSS